MLYCVIMQWISFWLGPIFLCVYVRVHVSLGACVLADPAFNSCRDPGTPAYGIPIMAQGFQVGNNNCMCLMEKLQTERRSKAGWAQAQIINLPEI